MLRATQILPPHVIISTIQFVKRCNLFPTVLQEVEMQLGKAKVPCDVEEEMKFVLTQAKKNVEA